MCVCGQRLVLFCVVDDHLHVVVCATRRQAGALAGGMVRSAELGGRRLAPAFVRPVEGRGHLEWLVGYLLTQASKHGLAVPDRLYEGSCFQDLVGARVIEGWDPQRIWTLLPRRGSEWAAGLVGTRPPAPLQETLLPEYGIRALFTASEEALATNGEGRAPPAVASRRAAASLAVVAGHPVARVAQLKQVDGRSVRRWLAVARPEHRLAARRRLTLLRAERRDR